MLRHQKPACETPERVNVRPKVVNDYALCVEAWVRNQLRHIEDSQKRFTVGVRSSCVASREIVLIICELIPNTRLTLAPNHLGDCEVRFGVERAHLCLRPRVLEALLQVVFCKPALHCVP